MAALLNFLVEFDDWFASESEQTAIQAMHLTASCAQVGPGAAVSSAS